LLLPRRYLVPKQLKLKRGSEKLPLFL
jgi:hypothetical protein